MIEHKRQFMRFEINLITEFEYIQGAKEAPFMIQHELT